MGNHYRWRAMKPKHNSHQPACDDLDCQNYVENDRMLPKVVSGFSWLASFCFSLQLQLKHKDSSDRLLFTDPALSTKCNVNNWRETQVSKVDMSTNRTQRRDTLLFTFDNQQVTTNPQHDSVEQRKTSEISLLEVKKTFIFENSMFFKFKCRFHNIYKSIS